MRFFCWCNSLCSFWHSFLHFCSHRLFGEVWENEDAVYNLRPHLFLYWIMVLLYHEFVAIVSYLPKHCHRKRVEVLFFTFFTWGRGSPDQTDLFPCSWPCSQAFQWNTDHAPPLRLVQVSPASLDREEALLKRDKKEIITEIGNGSSACWM